MRCLSCASEINGNGRVFNRKIILCHSCNEKAEAMQAKLDALLARSRTQLLEWFEQLILSGGLLKGSVNPPDIDPRSSDGESSPSDPTQEE
jgi:hypothetical protein